MLKSVSGKEARRADDSTGKIVKNAFERVFPPVFVSDQAKQLVRTEKLKTKGILDAGLKT